MHLILHRLKKRILATAATLTGWAIFVAIVLVFGLGSSWYMVEAGSSLTTRSIGPWSLWTSAARGDADPYTRAHFARLGAMPLSSDVASIFFANSDDRGQRLHSSCEYQVQGPDIDAEWWSVAVFDDRGRLIPNAAERYVFTSDTITLNPDATFTVSLARDARPRNWLPVGGAGRLVLVLTVLGPGQNLVADAAHDAKVLPSIRRVQCR